MNKTSVKFLIFIALLLIIHGCSKEKKLIVDLEKGPWQIDKVFIREINAGITAEYTVDTVTGYFEFFEYDPKSGEGADGEGKGHYNIPVYPFSSSLGYPKQQVSSDFYYHVIYGRTVQEIWVWTNPGDKYGTMTFYSIKEYKKKNTLVLSGSLNGSDDYYGLFFEYHLLKK